MPNSMIITAECVGIWFYPSRYNSRILLMRDISYNITYNIVAIYSLIFPYIYSLYKWYCESINHVRVRSCIVSERILALRKNQGCRCYHRWENKLQQTVWGLYRDTFQYSRTWQATFSLEVHNSTIRIGNEQLHLWASTQYYWMSIRITTVITNHKLVFLNF